MNKNKIINAALLLIVAGVILRIISIIHCGYGPHHEYPLGMDEVNYRELAMNILRFHIFGAWSEGFFAQSTRAPGYPLMLAAAYRLTSFCEWAPQFLNFFFDILNIFLTFIIANKIYGKNGGVLAVCSYSVYSGVFSYMDFSTPEIFSVTLLLLFIFSLILLKDSYKFAVLPLIFFYALLIHSKPVFLLCVPFLIPIVYLRLPGEGVKRRIIKSLVPVFLISFLCIPWGIRNYRVQKTIIPVCSIAGWHIVTAAQGGKGLSIDAITDYLYRADHENFTEGDFFKDSSSMFLDGLINAPFQFIYAGVLRLGKLWFPAKSFLRTVLPWAYIAPVYVTDRIFIPLPDFEGVFYLTLIFLLCAALWKRDINASRQSLVKWFNKSRELVIFCAVYAGVHVMGIPLLQYRFIIEPLILIILSGLFLCCFDMNIDTVSKIKYEKYIPVVILLLFMLLLIVPFIYRSDYRLIRYPARTESCPGFDELRKIQWRNAGNIPENTKASLSGIVRYRRDGCRFFPEGNTARKDNGHTVFKLYVNSLDSGLPLGIGDAKVNFKRDKSPLEGDVINIEGNVSTGKYKDIIVDVERWKRIPE